MISTYLFIWLSLILYVIIIIIIIGDRLTIGKLHLQYKHNNTLVSVSIRNPFLVLITE